jgi:hypothetical protein
MKVCKDVDHCRRSKGRVGVTCLDPLHRLFVFGVDVGLGWQFETFFFIGCQGCGVVRLCREFAVLGRQRAAHSDRRRRRRFWRDSSARLFDLCLQLCHSSGVIAVCNAQIATESDDNFRLPNDVLKVFRHSHTCPEPPVFLFPMTTLHSQDQTQFWHQLWHRKWH